jgi:hypothetical protein
MNDPNVIPYMFWIVIVGIGTCFCCDRYICKPIIKKLKNNPILFTPTHAPTQPPPNSPANSDTSSTDELPSPATMKPDYSSGEDYVDIYHEYIRKNSNTCTSYQIDDESYLPESP